MALLPPQPEATAMPAPRPVLYQFPISHYCEKARWALEYKNIDYDLVNLVPGPHRSALQKLGTTHSFTPVLVDQDKVIQGSEPIIDFLEAKIKHPPLTPTDPEASSMAHEWARFADQNIGIPLRLYFYFYILPQRQLAINLLTEDCPWWSNPLYAVAFPAIRKVMRSGMKINEENALKARGTLLRSLDQITERLTGRNYLVDNRFTRADLAVVALLAPCWRDIANASSELQSLIDIMLNHEAVQWAREVYANHRGE